MDKTFKAYIERAGQFSGIMPIPTDKRIPSKMSGRCQLTIVAPIYNEAENISKFLESLYNQKDSAENTLSSDIFELILVDNNSTDRSSEMQ